MAKDNKDDLIFPGFGDWDSDFIERLFTNGDKKSKSNKGKPPTNKQPKKKKRKK